MIWPNLNAHSNNNTNSNEYPLRRGERQWQQGRAQACSSVFLCARDNTELNELVVENDLIYCWQIKGLRRCTNGKNKTLAEYFLSLAFLMHFVLSERAKYCFFPNLSLSLAKKEARKDANSLSQTLAYTRMENLYNYLTYVTYPFDPLSIKTIYFDLYKSNREKNESNSKAINKNCDISYNETAKEQATKKNQEEYIDWAVFLTLSI